MPYLCPSGSQAASCHPHLGQASDWGGLHYAEKWRIRAEMAHNRGSASHGQSVNTKSVHQQCIKEEALTCSRMDLAISSSTAILAGMAARTQASHPPIRFRTGISRISTSFSILREPRLCENSRPRVSGCTEVAKASEEAARSTGSTLRIVKIVMGEHLESVIPYSTIHLDRRRSVAAQMPSSPVWEAPVHRWRPDSDRRRAQVGWIWCLLHLHRRRISASSSW